MSQTATIKTITTAAEVLTDEQIIEALKADHDQDDAAERVLRVALMDVLEGRHPEITPAMEAWSEDYMTELTQAEAMIQAIG